MSLMPSLPPIAGEFNLNDASYSGVFYEADTEIVSAGTPFLYGVTFANGKLYTSGYNLNLNPSNPPTEAAFSYTLAQAGSISGMSWDGFFDDLDDGFTGDRPAIGAKCFWNADGSQFMATNTESQTQLSKFNSATPFSILNLTYDSRVNISPGGTTFNRDVAFSPDGLHVASFSGDQVSESTRLTPFGDIDGTVNQVNMSATLIENPDCICFDNYGRKMIAASGNDVGGTTRLDEYSLSTPFKPSTMSQTGRSFDVHAVIPDLDGSTIEGMALNPNQDKLVFVSNRNIYEINLT